MEYLKIHLIPTNEEFWKEKNFKDFIEERRKLIIEKIRQANSLTI